MLSIIIMSVIAFRLKTLHYAIGTFQLCVTLFGVAHYSAATRRWSSPLPELSAVVPSSEQHDMNANIRNKICDFLCGCWIFCHKAKIIHEYN